MAIHSAALLFLVFIIPVLAIIGPPRHFVAHPHWRRVEWVPFSASHVNPTDVFLNLSAFFPFGFLYTWRKAKTRMATLGAGLLVLVVSAGCEYYQVYCHERFPGATDILCNTASACAGIYTGRKVKTRHDAVTGRDLTLLD